MKLRAVVSVGIIMLCSCINKKYLAKNQVIFKVAPSTKNKSKITAYRTGDRKTLVTLKNINGTLLIKTDTAATANFILPTLVVYRFDTTGRYAQLQQQNQYYYPETGYPQQGDPYSNSYFTCPPTLRFSENHFVFQVMTVPLKVRQAILYHRFRDSLPTQALAELNLGAAFGLKRTWIAFKAHPNEEGVSTVITSFACTGFLSFGATNVKPLTTQYVVPYEKSEYDISYGVNFLVGYYNLNLGLAIGADHLINQSLASKWIFDGRLWYGISVAYDIFGKR